MSEQRKKYIPAEKAKIALEAIIKVMESREKVLFLLSDENFAKQPSYWESNLHPAKHLEGRVLYHYALIKDSPAYPLGLFMSYENYLDKLD